MGRIGATKHWCTRPLPIRPLPKAGPTLSGLIILVCFRFNYFNIYSPSIRQSSRLDSLKTPTSKATASSQFTLCHNIGINSFKM